MVDPKDYYELNPDDLHIVHYSNKRGHVVKMTHAPTGETSSVSNTSFFSARCEAESLLQEKVRQWVDKNGPFSRKSVLKG